MEYLTALQIVSGVFLIVWVYRRGYNKARYDLLADAAVNKRHFELLSQEWITLKEHQKRAGLNVRPTLSVVTPIKNVSE